MKLIDGYEYKHNSGRQIEFFKFKNVTLIDMSWEIWDTADFSMFVQIGGGALLSFSASLLRLGFSITFFGKTYVY
jgi:hypothetical protein